MDAPGILTIPFQFLLEGVVFQNRPDEQINDQKEHGQIYMPRRLPNSTFRQPKNKIAYNKSIKPI